ncbi:MAG: hypothetical protein ACFE0K_05595, partial [Alcanivorax sp.]|uniref:hypothetical protein n=1 Tax=Alcanivorax sp. TaxID=1872427 RepID=UPI003DA77871
MSLAPPNTAAAHNSWKPAKLIIKGAGNRFISEQCASTRQWPVKFLHRRITRLRSKLTDEITTDDKCAVRAAAADRLQHGAAW